MLSFSKNKKAAPINTDKIDTLIGRNTEFIGTLTAEGTVRIDGRIKGDIFLSGNLIMGEQGNLKGNVKSDNIHLSGVINGNVESAGQLHITTTGKLYGDMTVNNIVIDEGGLFHGNCIMVEPESIAEAAADKEETD